MSERSLLEELKRRPLLCDGAMGTQLMMRGLSPGECGEMWNVNQAAIVEGIHRAYRNAGCDLITTNTFGGSAFALQRHGLGHRTGELNRAGARAAVGVAEGGAFVLGDMGPFGGFLEPVGETTQEELEDIFEEQAAALAEGGCDALIVETMSDAAELAVAVQAAKSVGTRPVIATYAFSRGENDSYRTMMGVGVKDAIGRAIGAGADVVGANCGSGLSLGDYVRLAEQLVAAAGVTPVILQPNAGKPAMVDGRLMYAAKPGDMAALVAPLLKAGVRIIGGCCGTTPEHLQAMAEAMKSDAGQ